MSRATRATINITALQHNLHRVQSLAPTKKIIAIVKANGYGHGIVRVVQALQAADGFGVASLEEALLLRSNGVTAPILLLEGFFDVAEIPDIIQQQIDMVIHQPQQLESLQQAGFFKKTQKINLWLKLDTGMHRLGFSVDEFHQAVRFVQSKPNVAYTLMSHLANADDIEDESSQDQITLFNNTCSGIDAPRSMANSAGILAWPDSHMDIVRPGIMLYGASPFIKTDASEQQLQPVMTLTTRLIAIKQLKKGDAVGYGGTWVCPEDMAIGVAAIGYGDGYPRHAPSGTPVLVNNVRVPLVGRVSMDMLTVDLRLCPGACLGDEVLLWGDGLAAEEIARYASTISYELFCGVTNRVEFIVTDN